MSYLEIIAWRGVCKGRGDLGWVARALKMLRCCERLGFRGSACVPGREWSVPERANFRAPRSPSWAPGGVFRRGQIGLLCGACLARVCGRWGPGGARWSRVFRGAI